MIPLRNSAGDTRRLTDKSRSTINAALTSLLLMTSAGCAHYVVIPADREIIHLPPNQMFLPKFEGWFVPTATWQEIRKTLSDESHPAPPGAAK